jgi:hypothetical protein
MRLRTDEQLAHVAARAAAAGIASQIHAIGDAAVRSALDVIATLPTLPGAMHRVEHAQLVDPADLLRFGQLDVAVSVQPGHLISDAVAMRRAWGPRATNAFPLAALSAAGAVLPLGTDAPVEPPDPWPGIAAAVMRRGPGTDPSETFHGAQSISLERALRAACLDGPRSARADDLGHLAVGAQADLVVLPAQVVAPTADPTVLGSMRPLATVLDGALIHATAEFDP